MIRFHLDEHLARLVANSLRQRGFDVTTPGENELINADDPGHSAFALLEDCFRLPTMTVFCAQHADSVEHARIALCQLKKYTSSQDSFCLASVTQQMKRGRIV